MIVLAVFFVVVASLAFAEPDPAKASEKGGSRLTDIFGHKGGYVHPYISVAELYKDNVFNTSGDKRSDFASVFIPGIWFAFPGIRKEVIQVEAANQTPGGLAFGYVSETKFRRLQGYLNYSVHMERYSSESDADTTDHNLQGYLQYNLHGGLRFELLELYKDGHDAWSSTTPGIVDEFKSNLIGGRITYDLGTKISLQGSYRFFTLDYDEGRNAYRDRQDQTAVGRLFYNLSPKSSVFMEYAYLDISYDQDSESDSVEHHFYGGFRWKLTGKTEGSVKAGYAIKDFARENVDNATDWNLQGELRYAFTPKTSITIRALRQYEETDQIENNSNLSNRFSLGYQQRITSKVKAIMNFSYVNTTYNGLIVSPEIPEERQDDTYQADFRIEYRFKKWLRALAGYRYVRRDSNEPFYSYDTNGFFMGLTFSL